jgi:hypothetical protein
MRTLFALLLILPLSAGGTLAHAEQWPGVYIPNQITRTTMHIALAGAASRLSKPRCRAVLDDFRDEGGVLLSARLAELGVDPATYLARLRFRDGSLAPQCQKPMTLMFTVPGSKVVYVCGKQLENMARQDRGYLNIVTIHELLHTLGLGENPPSSHDITVRVTNRCR